ncbi:MAG: DUF2306 domain-containing protein [Micromonosporaceae bacterium]
MSTTTELPAAPPEHPEPHARPRSRWWRRPRIGPLMLVVGVFVLLAVPPYLTGDPSQSRVPTHPEYAWYYPVLVGHIVLGSVVLVTACFQLWPWFRQRYPVAHRWMGRAYVAAAVPAGVGGLLIAPLSSTGVTSQWANTMMAVLWLPITVAGYRMARQRRFAEHRRWMIRSFALAFSIVTNRLWGVLLLALVAPHVLTQPEQQGSIVETGDQLALTAIGIANWMSWIVNLLIAEWWLERTDFARKHRARLARRAGAR